MSITRETWGIIWGLEWATPENPEKHLFSQWYELVGEETDAIFGATYILYICDLSS